MKQLKLTRKIPEHNAYLWDGTVESYRAIRKKIGGSGGIVDVKFHLDGDSVWLTVSNIFNSDQFLVHAGQYIVFSDKGTEIMSEDQIKRQFDIVNEQKVYTGSLAGGPLDAWNKSEILGDTAYAEQDKE